MTFRLVITIHFKPDVIDVFLIDFTPPIQPSASGTLGHHVDTNIFDFLTVNTVYDEDRKLKTSVRFKQLRFHH